MVVEWPKQGRRSRISTLFFSLCVIVLAKVRKGVLANEGHPLVLPSLDKEIYGAKATVLDF